MNQFYSHLAPRKIDGFSLLSVKPKVLYLERKANKNHVTLSRIFFTCTVFYGEVQDLSLALLHELDSSYTSKHSFESGQILHIFMLGVQDEYKNQKIATTLVQENLKLAKSHDFSLAIAEATGLISQHVFRKLGFREEVTFFYDSYTSQGEKIFSSIKESPGCKLMSYSIL
ncbi:MAG: GNAT family N-acetyltransferase [Iphinoe sp. HA4291-MV1]|nr:GNAT family N-acetyltransferase [Iphinoe sp. HA4291-MV1]